MSGVFPMWIQRSLSTCFDFHIYRVWPSECKITNWCCCYGNILWCSSSSLPHPIEVIYPINLGVESNMQILSDWIHFTSHQILCLEICIASVGLCTRPIQCGQVGLLWLIWSQAVSTVHSWKEKEQVSKYSTIFLVGFLVLVLCRSFFFSSQLGFQFRFSNSWRL